MKLLYKALSLFIIIMAGISCYSQTVTSVSPSSAYQKETLTVDISGKFTHFTQATGTGDVWFQQGTSTFIYPNSINIESDTKLTAEFTINYNYPTGKYDVTVNQDIYGEAILPNGFTVLASKPSSITIVPDNAYQKQTLTVTISGQNTHFAQGTSTIPVWFLQGTSTIYPDFVKTDSNTQLTAQFTIPCDADTGLYNINLFGPVDGFINLIDGFTIIANPLSGKIIKVTPDSVEMGQRLTVSISAQNTFFLQSTNTIVWLENNNYKLNPINQVNIVNDTLINVDFNFYNGIPYGFYDVFVYNSTDCKLKMKDGIFVNYSTPDIKMQPASNTVCEGESPVFYLSAIGTNLKYQWQYSKDSSKTWIYTDNGTYSFLSIYSATLTMNNYQYRCIVTGEGNLSNTSDVVTLIVNPNPQSEIIADSSIVICLGENVDLKANTDNGISYQWIKNNYHIKNANDSSFKATQPGIYTVLISNQYNCYSISQQVEVKPKIDIDLGADRNICGNDSVKLDAGPGFVKYRWSTGDTTQRIGFDSVGYSDKATTIYVTVTNNDSCRGTDSIYVAYGVCVKIKKESKEAIINIFPNPTTGIINIYLEGILNPVEYSILNLQGQIITKKKFVAKSQKSSFEIDMTHYKRGVYFLNIRNSKFSVNKKIILN